MRPAFRILPFLILTFLFQSVQAQTITQVGEGSVSAAPNEGYIFGGVVTTSPSVSKALAENATSMTKVVAALKTAGLTDADISTTEFSIADNYKRVTSTGGGYENVKDGYVVTNKIKATIKDLTKFGSTIDTMVTAGANDIDSLSFGNSQAITLTDKARTAAVNNATHRAKLIAHALGYSLGDVVSTSESRSSRPPLSATFRTMSSDMAPGGSPDTPISGGSQEYSITVNVQWKLVAIQPAPIPIEDGSKKPALNELPSGKIRIDLNPRNPQ